MDVLSHLFHYFPFRTDLFFIGRLCHLTQFETQNKGHLHIIRQGSCLLKVKNQPVQRIDYPCIVFISSEISHHIHPLNDELDIFCISFDFGEGINNPLTHTIQNIVTLQLHSHPELDTITSLIYEETEKMALGYASTIHHLCAYLTLRVVRCCLEEKHIKVGLLKGLTDKQLSGVLLEIHEKPEYNWQVDILAKKASMSRSRFASYFKQIIGMSPIDYITHWRITLAQTLLLKGLPIMLIADRVGYSHNESFTRAFSRIVGQSPIEWFKLQQEKIKVADNK
ncbi:AraC-like DNA-binding protein [Bisgaardia hudsonensis]|uniref:AraC-like DNA-binding protein n=1 Tax=Bisgaardia hudsonensis TaxID=109472 RepID=A0A4R2N0U5_9PAST|nr:AraC family transcriptional regulator [Bisgaardia hudsonensis]QLB13269.1 AraC family transcriptional regulator [Bisgaardia hudsonensis]TCP13149.1 AraC-like DNA-binding protein [Bisgaardia hudsonensis]